MNKNFVGFFLHRDAPAHRSTRANSVEASVVPGGRFASKFYFDFDFFVSKTLILMNG